jgi:Ni/Co efflux regulator RcnB
VRPGRYLPPNFQGEIIDDYGRYRLRPPPRGYAWVRIGRDLALVSMDDGRIFDVAPY